MLRQPILMAKRLAESGRKLSTYTFQQALAEGSADAIEKCHALEMKRFKAEYKRGDSQTYGSGPALFCQDVSEICVDA